MHKLLVNIALTLTSTMKQYRSYHGKAHRDHVILSEVMRNVHSIEKGLCMDNPRKGFGHAKVKHMLALVEEYISDGYDGQKIELQTAVQALHAYFDFNAGFESNEIKELKQAFDSICDTMPEPDAQIQGGAQTVSIQSVDINHMDFEKFIQSRHSIRSFSSEPIDKNKLWAAIELSRHAPSACNRQTSKVYILNREQIECLSDWLTGVGGFIDGTSNILIITGRMSAFNDGEVYQHIVNASIYATYLYLCLNAYGIEGCVIQRPLLYSRRWERFSKKYGIPSDEQVVCMIAVGIPRNEAKVPISFRFPVEVYAQEVSE